MAASTPEGADGLEGHLHRQLGRAAEGQQGVLLAERAVLGHVASRLAHEPHGRAIDGFAAAGAQEAIVHGPVIAFG